MNENLNDIENLYENETISNEDCCICLENKDSLIKTNCNHLFCEKCILEWFGKGNNTCPLCRKEIDFFSDANNNNRTRIISIGDNRQSEINTSLQIIQQLIKKIFKLKVYLFISLSSNLYYLYSNIMLKTDNYNLINSYNECEKNLTLFNDIDNSNNLIYSLFLDGNKIKECPIPEYYRNKCFENSFN